LPLASPVGCMYVTGYGAGYQYNHGMDVVDQTYLPDELHGTSFFKSSRLPSRHWSCCCSVIISMPLNGLLHADVPLTLVHVHDIVNVVDHGSHSLSPPFVTHFYAILLVLQLFCCWSSCAGSFRHEPSLARLLASAFTSVCLVCLLYTMNMCSLQICCSLSYRYK